MICFSLLHVQSIDMHSDALPAAQSSAYWRCGLNTAECWTPFEGMNKILVHYSVNGQNNKRVPIQQTGSSI